VVPRGGIFLDKWRSSFAGSSDGKMNVQSAFALNTRYFNSLFIPVWALKSEPFEMGVTRGSCADNVKCIPAGL
jgi:hypothetical protein